VQLIPLLILPILSEANWPLLPVGEAFSLASHNTSTEPERTFARPQAQWGRVGVRTRPVSPSASSSVFLATNGPDKSEESSWRPAGIGREGPDAELVANVLRHRRGRLSPLNSASGRSANRPPALQTAPGTRRDSLGAFLVAGAKNLPATLKRVLSHFAYDESPEVRTRTCCVVDGRPDSPKDLRGPLAASRVDARTHALVLLRSKADHTWRVGVVVTEDGP
jgi:hypothetical protein